MGRHQDAIAEVQRAQALDPASVPISQDLARVFYFARQYDQAISAALRTLELDPNYYRLNSWLEMAYQQRGLYDESIETRLKGMSVIGVRPEEIEVGRAAYRQSGWIAYWKKELELTRERAKQTYVLPYNIARIYARLGEVDLTFEWLEQAYKDRSEHVILLKVDPIFDTFRSDARYASLLRRVGFDR
jgi:tetratricopeptide (TPR) repeat protein